MRAETLLHELESRGVELRPAGDRLQYRPPEAVTPELLRELKEHKGEVLEILWGRVGDSLGGVEGKSLTVQEVCAMPLSQFANAGLVLEVRSAVLKETVIFASDNAVVDPGERRVVYRAAELEGLIGLGPRGLRRIHRVKRTFKGTILS
jgi:hypothetical protein